MANQTENKVHTTFATLNSAYRQSSRTTLIPWSDWVRRRARLYINAQLRPTAGEMLGHLASWDTF